jgi:hypothetical protein
MPRVNARRWTTPWSVQGWRPSSAGAPAATLEPSAAIWHSILFQRLRLLCVCVCVCLYMCVCVCTHTHTHTHANVGGGSSGLTVTRVCASGGVFVSRWEGAWERGDSTIRSLSMEAFPSFCTCARRARAQAPSACHPAPSSGKRGSGVRRCRDHGLAGAW